jgi:hypothetical protein
MSYVHNLPLIVLSIFLPSDRAGVAPSVFLYLRLQPTRLASASAPWFLFAAVESSIAPCRGSPQPARLLHGAHLTCLFIFF